jgi:hypothetical protein
VVRNDGDEVRSYTGSHTDGPYKVVIPVDWGTLVFEMVGHLIVIPQSGVLLTPPISTCNREDARINLMPPTHVSRGGGAYLGSNVNKGGG